MEHIGKEDLNKLSTRIKDENILWKAIILLILFLVLPIILWCLVLASVYKILCYIVIKWKDKNFVSFLDSFDVFWSLEDDASRSFAHVLGVFESNNPDSVIENIKEKLLSLKDDKGGKIFYKRKEKYGFYYWSKPDFIDIDQYVQRMDIPNKYDELDTQDLEQMLKNLSYQTLPFKGEGMFKMVVTKKNIVEHGDSEPTKQKYAFMLKVHHSLGDGITLITFLIQTFADNFNVSVEDFRNRPEFQRSHCKSFSDVLDLIYKLFEIIICLINMFMKNCDESSLHGAKLIGGISFKWINGTQENLYYKIKEIKNVVGVTFSDVVLKAVSQGLNNYFNKRMERVPKDVGLGIAVRQAIPSGDKCLENNFSLHLLDLPMNGSLELIAKRNAKLRESASALSNSCFIALCGVLPNCVLEPLMVSRHATMSFSNLPGPEAVTICGGTKLKYVVFFVPTKGTTGLGLTAFCYGDVLRLALSADSAIISDPEDLKCILDGMVAEVNRLHRQYVKK